MSHDSVQVTRPGQVIADRYRIEELLGQGAMGEVWSAVHLRLDSPVAIKFLSPRIADEPEMLERFMREAKSAAAVRSTHVVQIFDYGVDAGVPFIAMELLVGEALDARLDSRFRLAPAELDKIFGEVSRAVANAHDLGVVHRDIKPGNIFIAREGGHEVTKVLDFGIAKLLDQGIASPVGDGTHTGIILGTPNYMSPEQARGHRTIDHRSDLWSLAVLAFECLTGRQPFEGGTLGDLVVKICTTEPLLPSAVASVPTGFDAWFLRGVAKEPNARFASATDMADELHALLATEGLGAASRPRSAPPRKPEQTANPVTKTTRREPFSSLREITERAIPSRSMSTHGAVATEVSSVSRAPRSRRRLVALTVVLLAAASVAFVLRPGRGSLDAAIEQPHTARGAAPGEPRAPEPVSPAVKAPPSQPLTPRQPLTLEAPSATSEGVTPPPPAVAAPAAPPPVSAVQPVNAAAPPVSVSATRPVSAPQPVSTQDAKKPARKRPATASSTPPVTPKRAPAPPPPEPPAADPPPSVPSDPFSDRL